MDAYILHSYNYVGWIILKLMHRDIMPPEFLNFRDPCLSVSVSCFQPYSLFFFLLEIKEGIWTFHWVRTALLHETERWRKKSSIFLSCFQVLEIINLNWLISNWFLSLLYMFKHILLKIYRARDVNFISIIRMEDKIICY